MHAVPAETVEEILHLHHRLSESREVLHKIAVENLPHTNERLNVISSTTETAATNLLDGLEKALAMVDEIEGCQDAEARSGFAAGLRDQLFDLIGHLQFQDITSQQLAFSSSVILEAEKRLATIAETFGTAAAPPAGSPPAAGGPATFDPAATMLDSDQRQALADALFPVPGPR